MNKLPTGIINIEGERDLVRDRNSKALLNTNNESLKAYKIKNRKRSNNSLSQAQKPQRKGGL